MDQERDLHSPADAGPTGPELVDDWTRPVGRPAVRRGRGLPNLRVSTPVAFLTGVLVTALAAGVVLRPGAVADTTSAAAAGDTAAAAAPASGTLAGGGGRGDDAALRGGINPAPFVVDRTPEPTAVPEPTPAPTPEPTPEPTPTPTPKPTPTPVPALSLSLGIKNSHPYASWGSCGDLAFDYYKLVRSTDSTVSWPTGAGDTLVAAEKPGGAMTVWDPNAPASTTVHYRVFCVKANSTGGWTVLRSSPVKSIATPDVAPPASPTPCSISLGQPIVAAMQLTTQTYTGPAVTLSWTQCTSPGLTYYKVVRSSQPDPSYIRGTAGSVLIAAITPGNGLSFTDHPGAGTWYYRVEAVGNNPDGSHSLLGASGVVTVTIP